MCIYVKTAPHCRLYIGCLKINKKRCQRNSKLRDRASNKLGSNSISLHWLALSWPIGAVFGLSAFFIIIAKFLKYHETLNWSVLQNFLSAFLKKTSKFKSQRTILFLTARVAQAPLPVMPYGDMPYYIRLRRQSVSASSRLVFFFSMLIFPLHFALALFFRELLSLKTHFLLS